MSSANAVTEARALPSPPAAGWTCCDRDGGDDSPASNEDGTPAEIDGNEVIVRESWEDEQGVHFTKQRYPIDGQRFYWSNTPLNISKGSKEIK